MPAAPPRHLKHADDEVTASSAGRRTYLLTWAMAPPAGSCIVQETSSSSGESEVDADLDDGSHRAFHQRRWFRRILVPCTISLALFVAGFAVFVIMPRVVRHPSSSYHTILHHDGSRQMGIFLCIVWTGSVEV